MRVLKTMPSFNAVSAGQTAICNLPVGMAYHQLMIRYKRGAGITDATSAEFASDFTGIRLIVDGDTKWNLTAAELIAINSFYGVYDGGFVNGVLAMFFSRPWHRTSQSEDYTQFGTVDVSTMTLEIDIAVGVVNPTLSLTAVQGPNEKLGDHVCIRKFQQNGVSIGVREISDLPKGPLVGSVLAMHLGTANVNKVEVEANQRMVFQADKPLAETYYEETDRVWQAGYWHVDFASTDRLSDALPLNLEDFRLKVDVTAAGSFPLLMERVERRPRAA